VGGFGVALSGIANDDVQIESKPNLKSLLCCLHTTREKKITKLVEKKATRKNIYESYELSAGADV
jgi:hypothetical protein